MTDVDAPPTHRGALRRFRAPTMAALGALAAGFVFGISFHGSSDPRVGRLLEAVAVIGQLWVASMRMVAFPLVIVLTLSSIVGARRSGGIGALGGRAVLLFGTMLLTAGLLAFATAVPAVARYPVDAETASAFRAQATQASPSDEPGLPASPGAWLISLIPVNVFQAAVNGDILPVLLFTVLFGFAVRRLDGAPRELLSRLLRALADAMMVVVSFLLKLLPAGVFALCASFAYRAGLGATGVVAAWIVLVCSILLLATLLLYPLTAIAGGVSISRFAKAVAPAQVVAAGTRSSLASLPVLVAAGQRHLGLPASATGFVLPLAVASFKLDMAIVAPVKITFLAHVFRLPLTFSQMATVLAVDLILSFSTPGIPSVGTVRSIPVYLAAGIPLEGVLLLNAVETIPDIFRTLVNVTADMSAASILSRGERRRAAATPGSTARASGSSRSSS